MKNKISVIIPTYNTEQYIKECIESILNQTYQNFEIIVINDGSTDNTLEILNGINDERIRVITIENSGQGVARNLALKEATGDYIAFIDSDDFIEQVTFEVALNRILQDDSDFVYFDWKYYYQKTGKYAYVSKQDFFHKKVLEQEECKELLKIQHYFTVNKLYKKSFLLENNIKYGERYIYEDIPFWVRVCMSANRVSLIQSPLYSVRTNETSTTKSNLNTDRHVNGFIKAFDESIVEIKNEKHKYYFLNYMMNKFLLYYNKRTPAKLKKSFAREVYNRFKTYDIKKLGIKSRALKLVNKIHPLKSEARFKLYAKIAYVLQTNARKTKKKLKVLKNRSVNKKIYKKYENKPLKEQVLFIGFDYRYTGSSRYLYEQMSQDKDITIYFATENDLVKEENRINPNTKEFFEKLYTSKIVIFESWIPKHFAKPENAIWIDLWHGTPLKKMLYDSNEEEIVLTNHNHKKDKFKAIQKMNYLLIDNPNVSKYFETSFLIPKERILEFGYPRVKYLLENKENQQLKQEIRQKLNVDKDKKIIMYLPTWRDYNYKNDDENDFAYFLDKNVLEKELQDSSYVIISKDHSFLRKAKDVTVTDIETQELLLVSDFVITDYSSVMFDAFAIDIPVGIIAKDYEKYSKSRGLYEDMWQDLKPFVAENEKDLATIIKKYQLNEQYYAIKSKYGYESHGDLMQFIIDKLHE